MGKRFAIAACIAAIVIAGGALLYRSLFGEAPASDVAEVAPPPANADAPASEVTVVEIQGAVDREIDGTWVTVRPGDKLSPSDSIRTRLDGRAVLDVAGIHVELDRVSRLSSIVATRVELSEGRVSARVPSGREGFGVSIQGTDAVARTAGGEFAVLADGEGSGTVASVSGSVRVTARSATVDVPAGAQSIVQRGSAPSTPTPIPGSLFLKVQQPERKVQRARQLALSGTTVPGAVLMINGRLVEVDAEGRFSAVVDLQEGDNRVLVQSRDVAGRSTEEGVGVRLDTRGPNVGGSMKWGKDR
jgi:hypothetical protein